MTPPHASLFFAWPILNAQWPHTLLWTSVARGNSEAARISGSGDQPPARDVQRRYVCHLSPPEDPIRSFVASFLPRWFRYVPATCRKDLHGRTVPSPSAAARTTFSRRYRAESSPETPSSGRRPRFARSPSWLWREREDGRATPGWCVSTAFTDRALRISAVGRAAGRYFACSLTSSVWLLAVCRLSDLVCHLLVARCPLRPARTGDS
ncbi:hypothetical protein DFJ74DRAFT_475002 [Hyaloraphidium curvatum]|nr:hypothetical protein DFJ74DRAFT_475002 [Hyaloraphidium curvatum]